MTNVGRTDGIRSKARKGMYSNKLFYELTAISYELFSLLPIAYRLA